MGGGPRLDPQTRIHFGHVRFGCVLNASPHLSPLALRLGWITVAVIVTIMVTLTVTVTSTVDDVTDAGSQLTF